MKTPQPRSPKPSRETKRSFTWGIRKTDISFMRMTPAEAALDGSGGGGDCSAIARIDKPRRKNPRAADKS